jgi:hypothetical protein
MAIIGTFARSADGNYAGSLKTLTLSTKLVPGTGPRGTTGGSFFRSSSTIGFRGTPSQPLVGTDDDKDFNLLWSRRSGRHMRG